MSNQMITANSNQSTIEIAPGYAINIAENDFSLSFLVRPAALGAIPLSWDFGGRGVRSLHFVAGESATSCQIYCEVAGESELIELSGDPIAIDQWTHIAFTWQQYASGLEIPHSCKLYINAELVDSDSVANSLCGTTQGVSSVGNILVADAFGDGFAGSFDDLRIYNGVALSLEQFQAIYAGGIGTDVAEAEFASIASNGYYSAGNIAGNSLEGRFLTAGVWTDSYSEPIDLANISCELGGAPFSYSGTYGKVLQTFKAVLSKSETLKTLFAASSIAELDPMLHVQYAEDPQAPFAVISQAQSATQTFEASGPTFTASGNVGIEIVWDKPAGMEHSEAYTLFFNAIEQISQDVCRSRLLIQSCEIIDGPACGDPTSEYKDTFIVRWQFAWGIA